MKQIRPIASSIMVGKERKANPFLIVCKKCGQEIEMKKKSLTIMLATCKCGFEEEIDLLGGLHD